MQALQKHAVSLGVAGACPPTILNSFVFAYIFTEKCPCWRPNPPQNGSTPPYGKSWLTLMLLQPRRRERGRVNLDSITSPSQSTESTESIKRAVADLGFPVGGVLTHWGGANLRCIHFLAKTYAKTKEIDPVGGVHAGGAPLDLPMERINN